MFYFVVGIKRYLSAQCNLCFSRYQTTYNHVQSYISVRVGRAQTFYRSLSTALNRIKKFFVRRDILSLAWVLRPRALWGSFRLGLTSSSGLQPSSSLLRFVSVRGFAYTLCHISSSSIYSPVTLARLAYSLTFTW